MQIIRTKKYITSLQEIIRFISIDSRSRALAFRSEIDKQLENIATMPYMCRRSIYFDDEDIRDLVYKGYTVVYKIEKSSEALLILGIVKYQKEF